jgi:hypothetical protein
MLGHSPYYYETIKNITAAFGTIFSDFSIIRTVNNSNQTIKVPLSYSSKDKAFIRQTQDPNTNYNMARVFPAMAFQLTGITYDVDRMQNSSQSISKGGIAVKTPVPYDIHYELYIGSMNIEDGLQILEQILPFFAPSYNLTTKDWPTLGLKKDVPIVLNNVGFIDNTPDSDFTQDRVLEWTLTFTAKAYLYGPTSVAKPIKTVINHVFSLTPEAEVAVVTVAVNPPTATKEDVYTITTTINESIS